MKTLLASILFFGFLALLGLADALHFRRRPQQGREDDIDAL